MGAAGHVEKNNISGSVSISLVLLIHSNLK